MSNRSNSKIVKDLVRKEILDSLEGYIDNATNEKELLQGFYNQIEFCSKCITKKNVAIHEVIEYLLEGCFAGFEFENEKVRKFIDNLDLNNKSKKSFNNEEVYSMYKYLVSRETLYLFKKNNIEYKIMFYR